MKLRPFQVFEGSFGLAPAADTTAAPIVADAAVVAAVLLGTAAVARTAIAARFARSRVRLSGGGDVLTIEDDGPGLSDAQAIEALSRGKRLDEAEGGHGLGLAIAHELVLASDGVMELGRSELGGLKVELRWPKT